ncbi:VOC family protein [Jannaschia formosa]|uniref:VOC family protein n=1 Tax=Jannaschia formosa TaxID=2259592 RepID=UPI000E1BE4A6|nr:VOC family protein [Jannaschia formosa]TFL19931.1 VOC family protein [Jannaschia formosa]
MKITALDHLVLTVADIGATAEWYSATLGCGVETFGAADGTTRTALTFGRQKINLHRAGAEFRPHALHPGPGTADLCFLTDMPLDDWLAHLAARGETVEAGPVPRTGAQGPITSLYLRDPDGNLIEVAVRD